MFSSLSFHQMILIINWNEKRADTTASQLRRKENKLRNEMMMVSMEMNIEITNDAPRK